MYLNICGSQAETASERWAYLKANFLENRDHDVLDTLQGQWVLCKQGPEQPLLEHAATFHSLKKQLVDLGAVLASNERYVYTIIKQSLNVTFSEILRPLEVVNRDYIYEQARMELIWLEERCTRQSRCMVLLVYLQWGWLPSQHHLGGKLGMQVRRSGTASVERITIRMIGVSTTSLATAVVGEGTTRVTVRKLKSPRTMSR